MKIYNKIVLDKDNNIIEEDHFEYNGPITYCGGGGGSAGDSSAEAAMEEDYAPPTQMSSPRAAGAETGWSPSAGSETNWSESDDYESDFSDTPSASEPETYSAPPSDSYQGLDNEQQAELDQKHYQDWVQETQYPQYEGNEDLEEQREKDIDFAVDKGLITIDPNTGEQSPGPNVRNDEGIIVSRDDPSVKQDLTWKEHWDNRPDAIKWSPTLSLLYATGKNVGEWFAQQGWGSATGPNVHEHGGGDGDGATGEVSTAQSNYITSGQIVPSNSVAANWYQNLGSSSVSGNAGAFNLASEYAAAQQKVKQTLGNPSAVGMLAVNDSPFFDFLQKHNLTKGIL